MIRALWTAGSGMLAQQLNIDTISNNLANVNTIGFKKMRAEFEDLMYQTIRAPGSLTSQEIQVPTGLQLGHGVRPVANTKIFTQGDFQQSDNPLDLVVEGDGFFQILLPDNTMAYTRSGAFKVDGEGRLVTSEGYLVQPEITFPEGSKNITIGPDGTISVNILDQMEPEIIGQLEIVTFINPAGLINEGKSLFRQSLASGQPIVSVPGESGSGMLIQGYLEMSNVKVVEEMINMIVAQRAYDINSKAVQASDEMLQVANNLRR